MLPVPKRGHYHQQHSLLPVAQTAIEHNLHLLHDDRDFVRMRKVVDLKFFPP